MDGSSPRLRYTQHIRALEQVTTAGARGRLTRRGERTAIGSLRNCSHLRFSAKALGAATQGPKESKVNANGTRSSTRLKDGSDFLRTIAPYQQVTSIDASFLGSCAVGVPLST